MKTPTLIVFLAFLFQALSASPSTAQSARTFVSGTGTDSGSCFREAPCRTFAYAITTTPAGGEIVALDPADYGPVTIGKAISLVGPGSGMASISMSGGTGIEINAGSTDIVKLRGIEIAGSGDNGINLDNFGSLVVTDSVIRGPTYGIISFVSGEVTIVNSTIANAGDTGIYLGGANLTMSGSRVFGSVNLGISVSGTAQITSSTFVNTGTGVSIRGSAFFKDVVFTGNNIGVATASFTTVSFDKTTITGNQTGTQAINSGAVLNSYGNNNIFGNGVDVSGTPTTPVKPN